MKRTFFILTICFVMSACGRNSNNSLENNPLDSSTVLISDLTNSETKSISNIDTLNIAVTYLHDTTTVSGNFILFLRPDDARFESYAASEKSGIFESDSDFGFGIANTQDSIENNKKYKNIKAFVSTDRYIIIKGCYKCPLTIDRDTINYGVILSSPGKKVETNYGFVHSGNYLQEIDDYFKIKK